MSAAVPAPLVLSPLRRRIVSAVTRSGTLSRADVARRLGLSRSSLSPEISALLELGVLTVNEHGPSTGGRRGGLLAPGGPEVAVLAGVDIDADRLSVALTSLGGDVLAHETVEMAAAEDPATTLTTATDLIRRFVAPQHGPVLAVGVSIAADVEPDTGRPVAPPTMPRWAGWPVSDHFAQTLGLRTFIDNDVNVLALAEAATPATGATLGGSFVVLKLSRGLGCGIVVDGAVFRGSGGFAGDLGHICVDRHDQTICACGNRGCLEVLAGAPAIVRDAETLAAQQRSPLLAELLAAHGHLTLPLIGQASAAGDAAVGSLLREVGNRIGFVLAGIVSFFNPATVVVSSDLGGGEDILLNAIRAMIYQRALPFSTRGLQVTRSQLGQRGGAVSAAVLAGQGFLGAAGAVAETRPTAGGVAVRA